MRSPRRRSRAVRPGIVERRVSRAGRRCEWGRGARFFLRRRTRPKRTYFFNVKENRTGDLFLNIVESKKSEEDRFERRIGHRVQGGPRRVPGGLPVRRRVHQGAAHLECPPLDRGRVPARSTSLRCSGRRVALVLVEEVRGLPAARTPPSTRRGRSWPGWMRP